jgi:hypothetical protein
MMKQITREKTEQTDPQSSEHLPRRVKIGQAEDRAGNQRKDSSNGKTSIVYYRTLSFFAFRF